MKDLKAELAATKAKLKLAETELEREKSHRLAAELERAGFKEGE